MILTGCKKQAQTETFINEYRTPTCEENPLFCEDFEDNDLPEHSEGTDTGE